jgi:hypothetical protein
LSRILASLQVERNEAFGEPTIDGREKIVDLLSFALVAPQPRHAYRYA